MLPFIRQLLSQSSDAMRASTASKEEQERAAFLQDAQNKAVTLFGEIERDLIRPGITESELSNEIWALGKKRHDRTIEPDDILFIDLGPVFEAWEADFGRTFVLGDDPIKKHLRDSLEVVWSAVKARFDGTPDMTGEQLYVIACEEAKLGGWALGGVHAGHLVGDFPHERIPKDKVSHYITTGSKASMRSRDAKGHMRHWILEIHLVDRDRGIGAFYEQLLTVG
ncbi:hypothetical protein LTR37_004152 [Vermiconidia calcicola]|uniref:Uncharacterized protein n=1 Tax=Vermiconidia calcicola TaxID=1690605 RepID=A0ACC3NMW8_9PEZI|nr:hypothetical protein LTR37_004152 [Vermiconidia calcicola]